MKNVFFILAFVLTMFVANATENYGDLPIDPPTEIVSDSISPPDLLVILPSSDVGPGGRYTCSGTGWNIFYSVDSGSHYLNDSSGTRMITVQQAHNKCFMH